MPVNVAVPEIALAIVTTTVHLLMFRMPVAWVYVMQPLIVWKSTFTVAPLTRFLTEHASVSAPVLEITRSNEALVLLTEATEFRVNVPGHDTRAESPELTWHVVLAAAFPENVSLPPVMEVPAALTLPVSSAVGHLTV